MTATVPDPASLIARALREGVGRFVVAAVVRDAGRVLLLRRPPHDFLGGVHELPSGEVEPGEDLGAALVREVREETGLDVTAITGYVGHFDYRCAAGALTRQFTFIVDVASTGPVALSEHDEYLWQPIAVPAPATEAVQDLLDKCAGIGPDSPPAALGRSAGHEGIADADIAQALDEYRLRHPEEAPGLAEAARMVAQGTALTSRATFPLHVTAGALLLRGGDELLLVEHRAYGIWLQPGGHLEPEDLSLDGAAVRELVEETGIDPARIELGSPLPVYVECGMVPARPDKGEPAHWHLDFGYLFTTDHATGVGRLQDEEVTGAAWQPIDEAERLIGPRARRAVDPDHPLA